MKKKKNRKEKEKTDIEDVIEAGPLYREKKRMEEEMKQYIDLDYT